MARASDPSQSKDLHSLSLGVPHPCRRSCDRVGPEAYRRVPHFCPILAEVGKHEPSPAALEQGTTAEPALSEGA
jgi:hypothetical protein